MEDYVTKRGRRMDKMEETKAADQCKDGREKRPFSNELAYVVGILAVALGVAFMERADFGVSMVVAPAYLLYLKLLPTYSFFTFGMAEYTLQAMLLVAMCLFLRRFKLSYLFSFVTAVIYGVVLDMCMLLVRNIVAQHVSVRLAMFVGGMFLCSVGISFFFHSYISPEVYELFVKEVSCYLGRDINKFKTAYDCTSCIVSIAMSFAFFGMWHFEGVKVGTIFCALVNGSMIGSVSKFLESRLEFRDSLKLRKYFEQ